MSVLRIAALVTAALLGAAVSASAEEQAKIDRNCGDSTPEMVECLNTQAAAWDKRLNAAYKSALDAAEGKQRDQLRTAQRRWLQYRDANCTYYYLGEGSIARIEAADCTRRMTKARALELEGKDEGN